MTDSRLPYGVDDLDPSVVRDADDPERICCYVKGCTQFVRRPTKYRSGQACPEHGIFCHFSRDNATYSYADVRRNIIASPDLFAMRVVGHPFKHESDRLNYENSEDALSWNVFRFLHESGQLAEVARLLTGVTHTEQPRLYLWGLRVDDDSLDPWNLLIAARERFESALPVDRPKTEPDIALHLPGKCLVLIEAKFTSLNSVYGRGPRRDDESLTLDELLDIYQDPSLTILDRARARDRDTVHYQFWRNMVFAEWMALKDSPHTEARFVSLVRRAGVKDDAQLFGSLLADGKSSHFRQVTWEDIATQVVKTPSRLQSYLANKSARLRKAFAIAMDP